MRPFTLDGGSSTPPSNGLNLHRQSCDSFIHIVIHMMSYESQSLFIIIHTSYMQYCTVPAITNPAHK